MNDCGDNSDEDRCTCKRGEGFDGFFIVYVYLALKSNCKSFEISCSNQTASQCVSLSRVCDGTDDCEKGFDEMHCQRKHLLVNSVRRDKISCRRLQRRVSMQRRQLLGLEERLRLPKRLFGLLRRKRIEMR